MELVDIWHFALSACIIDFKGDIAASAKSIAAELASGNTQVTFDQKNYDSSQLSLLDNLELMTGLCAAKRFSVPLFMQIVVQCDMSADELYRQYVGKNVLNFFRQDNGYKDGTYIKVWQGREDNEHLVDVMNALDLSKPEFSDLVYEGLKARYPQN